MKCLCTLTWTAVIRQKRSDPITPGAFVTEQANNGLIGGLRKREEKAHFLCAYKLYLIGGEGW